MVIERYVWLAIIIAIVVGLGWWHHSTIVNEDRRLELAQQQAVQQAKDAANAQRLKDAQNAAATIDNLQNQLDTLRGTVLRTAPVVRLCGYANSPGPVPPARGVAGETSGTATGAGGVRGMPPRDTGGTDVGAAVLDLAYAGGIVAAYRNATVKWAMDQK